MEIVRKKMQVSAIENGTVLDHIPSKQLFRVIDILQLQDSDNQITFGINLDSKDLGKKSIIKIANRFFRDDEINRIALIAPKATINIIRNFKVVEKKVISIPNVITGIAKCMNPMCVTNNQDIETKFNTLVNKEEIELQCCYCEKITDSKHLKIVSNTR